jgi:hypothetical protein
LVFFRLKPFALKRVLPLYLAGLTLLANTNIVLFFIIGLSFKYHNGIEAYFCVVLYIATTLIVTLPSFKKYFFSKYGAQSLKMLGWA